MALVSILVGSSTGSSPAAGLGSYVQAALERAGHTVVLLDAQAIDAASLLDGDSSDPDVVELVGLVEASDGVVAVTPMQNNSYSGVLKALLDILPHDALAGKILLPLATGGSNFHASALEYALVPVLRNLGAQQIVSGAYVLDRDIEFHPCEVVLAGDSEFEIDSVVDAFAGSFGSPTGEDDWTSSVSARQALSLLRDGATLLDVRSDAQEPDSGDIVGATVVPKPDIEERFGLDVGGRVVTRFEKNSPILVFCNGARGSRPVALRLEALGYSSVRQVRGGFQALLAEQHGSTFHVNP
ncbi:NAD(P)H-dependent oxidoreductase [Rhodococcoides kyotonense]|uniref:FMN reductase, SsuE family n=1 Tax=Rhodococcoides kyotonense TaxID=398843 RepID=A0A239GC45_9NOCA|nr:NAD(P)H-dependent oxidoreductase [Rhodococcus kyotonensis]SNS66282.1 FMN reductase, SsuE family [Rhodococcus kyotonensis]